MMQGLLFGGDCSCAMVVSESVQHAIELNYLSDKIIRDDSNYLP